MIDPAKTQVSQSSKLEPVALPEASGKLNDYKVVNLIGVKHGCLKFFHVLLAVFSFGIAFGSEKFRKSWHEVFEGKKCEAIPHQTASGAAKKTKVVVQQMLPSTESPVPMPTDVDSSTPRRPIIEATITSAHQALPFAAIPARRFLRVKK